MAGCGGGSQSPTAPVPPDALVVVVDGSGRSAFRIALECAVADRATCAEVLEAIGEADADGECAPLPADPARVTVEGTIDGERVAAVLRRRTTCEARAHDRVVEAVGL